MVNASIARPLIGLLALLYALLLGSAVVQGAPLEVQAPGLDVQVGLDGLAAPSADALALDSVAPTDQLLARPFDVPLRASSIAPFLPAADAGSATRSESTTGSAWASAPAQQAAEVAAAGAVAAAGLAVAKFEPLRRAAFLLALPLYSRLRRHELLENGVRERIYRSVETQPGLSIIQVCRAGKVGWGTAVYHLQRLERDRLIVSRRDGQYRRFFLNGQAPDPSAEAPGARLLQQGIAQRIATFVAANPQAAQKDVCAALGIAPPLASKWLGRLQEAGLLTSQREWKLVRYTPTPQLQQALATQGPVEVAAAP